MSAQRPNCLCWNVGNRNQTTQRDPIRNIHSVRTRDMDMVCMLVDGCFYNLDVLLSAPYKVADETPESSQSHDVIINSPIKCIASKQKTPFPLQRWDILPNGADTERPLRMS
jgi:hypothetical protein